jgi:hypothetical protein
MSSDLPSKKKVAPSLLWSRAARVAGLKLRFRSERQLQATLEGHGFTLADAYKVGAEEAQGEIQRRLIAVADKLWTTTDTAELKLR